MSQEYVEISKKDIKDIENTINSGFSHYRLNSEFNVDSFKKAEDVTIVQLVADEEYELPFKTKEEDGKYYISASFEIIKADILNAMESENVLESVSKYFRDVISEEDNDFQEECDSLVNFLSLTGNYDEDQLKKDLDPSKIRDDYRKDYEMINKDDSLNRVQKSLSLKELVHMSVCQVVNDIDLFFTRPLDLTPEEEAEKDRQEAESLKNEMNLS